MTDFPSPSENNDKTNQNKEVSKSSSSSSKKIKPTGPATGGFFDIHLPENWGTIRMWAEQQQVSDNGYEQYVLRFNDQTTNVQQPKPLEGNQLIQEQFGQDIKETNTVSVCSGNVEQTLEPLARPQPQETVKIQWNEYSYEPFAGKCNTISQPNVSDPSQQTSRHFEETLRRRG